MRQLLGLVTALLLALTACGGDSDGAALDEAAIARGVVVYQTTCQGCHGPDGIGVEGLGKPWVNSEFIDGLNDDEMLQFLIEGRTSDHPDNTTGIAMMPRGGNMNLTDADLLDVIVYMRSLNLG
jgi:mono/diheme cytochrome c family protein